MEEYHGSHSEDALGAVFVDGAGSAALVREPSSSPVCGTDSGIMRDSMQGREFSSDRDVSLYVVGLFFSQVAGFARRDSVA